MEKRILGRTGIEVGVIGFGCEGFDGKGYGEVQAMVDAGMSRGINFYDMYTSNPDVRKNVGDALARYPRERYVIQGHICSCWEDGQYYRSRNIEKVKEAFDNLLEDMQLAFVDVGMIHYVDTLSDFEEVFSGDVMKYCLKLKKEGKLLHIGLSTHNTEIAKKAVESRLVDVIMFSVNPAYDMLPSIDDVNLFFEADTYQREYGGIDPEREQLYALCQNEGVALTVMKCFAGGLLLDENQTPFGRALTPVQCIHYCLTRPAVAVVLGGMATLGEIEESVAYCEASEEAKDFGAILGTTPKSSFKGHCMYCGHCAPCTVKIDIASVNKYLDLAEVQGFVPETVREHYATLAHHAGECVACGKCIKNCPFGVDIIAKMITAKTVFGK